MKMFKEVFLWNDVRYVMNIWEWLMNWFGLNNEISNYLNDITMAYMYLSEVIKNYIWILLNVMQVLS